MLIPKTLPTIHYYNTKVNQTPVPKILNQSWYGRLTKTNVFQKCVICGTSGNIHMHHVRAVKDVKIQMKTGHCTFKSWIGATQRKQIPLCQYHHTLYHKGELLNYELNLRPPGGLGGAPGGEIARYSENLSNLIKILV